MSTSMTGAPKSVGDVFVVFSRSRYLLVGGVLRKSRIIANAIPIDIHPRPPGLVFMTWGPICKVFI